MALLLRSFSLQTKQSLALWRQMTLSAASAPSQAFILRSYSNESSKIAKSEGRKDVGEAKPIGERVKETAKTTSYLGVILLGVGVTGIMFYTIFSELFSSNSPQSIYSKAFDKCKDDPRVQDSLGQPIKCFGEESRRRRRTHVAHQIYQKNERNYMRLSFHIQGIRGKATVHCEMREVSCYTRDETKTEHFFVSRTTPESTSTATSSSSSTHTLTPRSSSKTTGSAIQSTRVQPTMLFHRQFCHKSLPDRSIEKCK